MHTIQLLCLNMHTYFGGLRFMALHIFRNPGLEVIKIEYSLKLKIRRNDWLLADTCVCKQPIIVLYFEFENELKFYNLEA